MDGDFRQPRTRQRDDRLVTDVTPERGLVARTFHSVGRLVPLRLRQSDAVPETQVATRRRLPWVLISFFATVVVPAIGCDVYLAFIASDQYIAEARAVVRSAEQESAVQSAMASSGSSSPSSALSLSTVTPNAYIVTNYIRSRAMVDDLSRELDLRAIFRRPEADFWARLKSDPTIEELVEYWQQMASAYVDGPSGIVTVKIRAFRREDAQAVAQAVVKLSERLVNDMSERARRDAMQFAEREVQGADGRVRAALVALQRYRDENQIIDPVQTATETAKLLLDLMGEKIRSESDLFVASRSLSRNAPSIQNMTARVEIIDMQIAKLKATLTGDTPDIRNVAAKLARFEELEVRRQFAERLYTMAQDGLERARMTAERQAVFLTVFVAPSLPEEATFPRRVAMSLLIPLGLCVLWSIAALTWASVEDHRV